MKTWISFLFLNIFFISNSWSIEDKEVIERLTWDHGPEWKTLFSSNDQKTKIEVFNILKKLALKNLNLNSYPEFRDREQYLSYIAISELGNFSHLDNQNGNQVLNFYKKKLIKNNDLFSVSKIVEPLASIITGISNIGTPESIELLMSLLNKDEEVHDFNIIRSIEVSLEGRENFYSETDFKSNKFYAPNTFLNYKKRQGDWKKTIKKYRTKLGQVSNQDNISRELKNTASIANLKHSKKPIKVSSIKKQKSLRKIASKDKVQTIEQKNEAENSWILKLSFFIVLLLAIYIFVIKKKS